jgi:hypothetical protein
MTERFRCIHCRGYFVKNPRLKGKQSYCGSKGCQQARKNLWEKNKLGHDPCYKAKRVESQKKGHRKIPRDQYQAAYRVDHPDYCRKNNEKQILRNQKRKPPPVGPKIVNTDTLIQKSIVPQGLYVLIPCEGTDTKKIVNTDALFVQMYAAQGFDGSFMSNTV